MSLTLYYVLFATVMLLGTVATVLVGMSKKNKEGNPAYDSRTKSYWSRLSWIYLIVIAAGYIALLVYIINTSG